MSAILNKLESKLLPLAEVISKNKYLISIRDGFLISMPLLIVGSLIMLFANFPIPAWIKLLSETAINGVSISAWLDTAVKATFAIMSIFVVLGIGYNFSRRSHVEPLFGGVVALLGWFMLMPFTTVYTPEGGEAVLVNSIPLEWVGARGIFIGILCAFLAVTIYKTIVNKGWIIKMPAGVPPTVANSFSALIPIAVVIGVFLIIRLIFILTPWGNAFNFIFQFLQLPLQNIGDSLGAMVLVYLFAHILWLFGIHGTNITDSIFSPILYALSAENFNLVANGQAPVHIITKQFQDLFATYGGAGSTLSLLVAVLFVAKSKRLKQLGKLSIVPGIFGINEPVIFGLPVVLNPVIAVPFIFVPMMNIVVSWFAMNFGLVPLTNGVIMPWTTPPIISGFLSSGWQGSVLQAFLIVIGIFIYMPFVKTMDKSYILEEEKALSGDDDEISFDDVSF